jgi:hypothetical protein
MSNTNNQLSYKEEVAKYTKKDAIHALLFSVYVSAVGIAFWFVATAFDWRYDSEFTDGMTLTGRIISVVLIPAITLIPLFAIVKKKAQGIHSLGIHLSNWKKAIFGGLLFFAVIQLVANGLLAGFLADWQMHTVVVVALLVIYRIIMAFWEDVIFIGYIQTRIYGIINNDILAVVAGGFVFAVVHYPNLIAINIVTGGDFGLNFWINLAISTFIFVALHAIMNTIFRHFRSIIPVTLFHASFNLAAGGFFWYSRAAEGGINEGITYTVVFSIVLLICVILPYFKKRKAQT